MGKLRLLSSLVEDMVWSGLEHMSVRLRVCAVGTVAVLRPGCLFHVAWPRLKAGRAPSIPWGPLGHQLAAID